MNTPQTGPAGWHPDPHGGGGLRYFDGTQWTEHTAPGPQASPQPSQATGGFDQTPLNRHSAEKTPMSKGKKIGIGVAAVAVLALIGTAMGEGEDGQVYATPEQTAVKDSDPAPSPEPSPEPMPELQVDENTLTAPETIAAIQAAGLPLTDLRDNTENQCYEEMPCVAWWTSEDVSIAVWPDSDWQKRWEEAGSPSGSSSVGSNVTLVFLGRDTTPAQAKKYVGAVRSYLANRP